MNKKIAVLILSAVFVIGVLPCTAENMDGMQMNTQQATDLAIHKGHGVVNKVFLDAGKANISHEAIASLKWPNMTMDFNVQDKAGLSKVQPGMKVDFDLAKFKDGYRITRIVPARR